MNNITRNFARYLALSIIAAAIGGGAVLGSAAIGNAAPSISPNNNGNFFAPSTKATPPVLVQPGGHWHRHYGVFQFNPGQ